MSLSSLTIGTGTGNTIPLEPNKYTGYTRHLAGVENDEIRNDAITAVAQESGSTLSYSMKNASTQYLTVENISGWKVCIDGITDGATGTLCIGVTYGGVTNTYEIGIIVDPTET